MIRDGLSGEPFESFLDRPLTCLWEGCDRPAKRHVFPFDGLHPSTMFICVEHEGVLLWLGVTMPPPPLKAPARHWLDDEAEPTIAAPPWRVVEWGLAGAGRRRATRPPLF